MDIGKSITIALRDKRMKKKELAMKLHVTPATVSTLCKNTECSGRMIKRLCQVFDMTASEFIALGE